MKGGQGDITGQEGGRGGGMEKCGAKERGRDERK